MTKRKKLDGRRNNGRLPTGLTEDQQLVRGSSALLGAMRALAQAEGQAISEIWRRAARALLGARPGGWRD